jgi:hypothetical protein
MKGDNAWIINLSKEKSVITTPHTSYDVKVLGDDSVKKYLSDDKKKPNTFKMLEFGDIIKYDKPKTREYLLRYGFTEYEINWLEDEGYIEG